MIFKELITWDDFYKDTLLLCEKIKASLNLSQIVGIVCISRGGLVPSAIVSSQLIIKNVEILAVSSYDDNNDKSEHKIMTLPQKALECLGKNWLVIDELVDQGGTFNLIKNILTEANFFCVYSKNKDLNKTCYVKSFNQNTWLVFPWEKING